MLLDAMPSHPTDLLVLPYFSATGTPYFDTRAKGAIIGLQLSTTKGEITRALLEGVALEMKLNLAADGKIRHEDQHFHCHRRRHPE